MTEENFPSDETSSDRKSTELSSNEALLINEFEELASRSQLLRLQERIHIVSQIMNDFIQNNQGEPEILYKAANHLLIAGGKRFRSLLSVIACEAVGGDPKAAAPIALAEELLQTASLIHDDMIDKDNYRRNVETVHRKYGNQVAIIAGDLLIAQAIRLIGMHGTLELITNVGLGGIKMCEGEVADYIYVADEDNPLSTTEYLLMIESKTVAFIREAVRSGASFGNASKEQLDVLIEYGTNLGYAFQIRDDILDITASARGTGKSVLSDLKKRGINYLLIHALEVVSEKRRKQCLQELSAGNIKDALNLIKETEAIQHAEELAETYVIQAKNALKEIDLNEKDLFEVLADYAVKRTR